MKKLIFCIVCLFCLFSLQAQSTDYNIKVGDVLVIGKPSGSLYTNIDFPRKNIITKRGAIPNFNGLIGLKVIVQEVENTTSDSKTLTIKRKDGLKFFRFYPSVKADLNKAIESGELKTTKFSRQNAIAQQ